MLVGLPPLQVALPIGCAANHVVTGVVANGLPVAARSCTHGIMRMGAVAIDDRSLDRKLVVAARRTMDRIAIDHQGHL